MRFGILGPLEVRTSDGRPIRVPEVKVRALLADLLVHEGRAVPVDRLIEDLWGESRPANPVAALQTKVSQLRRALKEAEPGGEDLVVSRPPGYLLRLEPDALDAHRFQTLTARAWQAADPRIRAALLSEALSLWRGPALADFRDEEFARPLVTRLEERRLAALEEQAAARLDLGEHSLLASELDELVVRHPLRERLRAVHLKALYRAGRQGEALAGYHELRRRLREELGVDPSPELVALHRAILAQDPALAPVHVPATSAARPRGNLPAPLTELIGRDDAVERIGALLETGRLVTLIGPGGVGKTRLAVATAARLTGAFPDGVWLVELSALDRATGPAPGTWPVELVDVVAAALGIRDDAAVDPRAAATPPPADPTDRLLGALRVRKTLLLLDNCEHVIGPVAGLAARLLAAAPELRILATSREPLGISGELLWPVPPLDPPGEPVPADPAALMRSSAVRLFVARAASAMPGFALDSGNAAAVAMICRRLDGIPLALELAATRIRALGVHELAARLDDRFRLLTAGHRDAPARQRTLRAMLDWSWELLTEPERIVLRRLAVHADGCTLEAAEEVCAGDGVAAGEVVELLARLVDRSLVVATVGTGGPRYRLYESVAAYCVERLHEAGESDRLRWRHGRHYAALAERAAPHLRGHDQRRWLERLDAETANLRAALEHAVRTQDADLALRLVNALAWYWFLRGRLGEGHRSLALALSAGGTAPAAARAAAMAWQTGIAMLIGECADPEQAARTVLGWYDEAGDPGGRARAEWFLGFAQWGAGDQAAGEERVARALAGFRELGDRWGVAAALSTRATQALFRGDLAALKRNSEESAALFRELGDRWGQLQATESLAVLAEINGDYRLAARLNREGLRMAEDLGLWTEVSYRLSGLGRIALLTGDHAAAEEFHQRARRLAVEQSSKVGEQFAELGLALGARRQGRLETAEAYLRNWLEWDRALGGHAAVAFILAELGFIAEQRGDRNAALALHLDGFAAARATGDARAIALALEGLAGAEALAGRPERAAELLGAADAARRSAGAPLPPAERGDVDRIATAARRALGEEVFAAAFHRGGALPPEAHVRRLSPVEEAAEGA